MKTMHHDNYWSAHPCENRVPFEVDGKEFPDHNRFHDNIFCLYPDREKLVSAKNRFLKEGLEVSGCVTTTNFGKRGIRGGKSFTGMDATPCYSNKGSQEELQRIFEYSASIFDEIMIDDFFFTSCECEECTTALEEQPWSEFYCDLMVKVSRERILKPSKAVNPNAKVIIKFPLWHDNFHNRGYDVVRQSGDYDKIYVGTETRDVGEVHYAAYFIMRWLGGIGGDMTGGGWFDTMGTTPNVFLEQARQTVLAGAKELMMWSYGQLIREIADYSVLVGGISSSGRKGTGIANVNAFREELPGLFELARFVSDKPVKGIHLTKWDCIFSVTTILWWKISMMHRLMSRLIFRVFSMPAKH